jgi:hypothetical protein
MKANNNKAVQSPQLNSDSQHRLVAYTTAAGLGAFFVSQSAEAQVTLSSAFVYPATMNIETGAAGYNYINIDGVGNEFNLDVTSTRVTMGGIAAGDLPLNPSSNGYVIPWTAGSTIGPGSGSAPTYKKWLATSGFDNFSTKAIMGFEFVSGGSTNYGYMDIKVTKSGSTLTGATISDIYYNKTANTAITIAVVPEPSQLPSSLALLAVGVVGMAARRIRRERTM